MSRFTVSAWDFEIEGERLTVWPSARAQTHAMVMAPLFGAFGGAFLGWLGLEESVDPAPLLLGLPVYAGVFGILLAVLWLWQFTANPLYLVDRRKGILAHGQDWRPLDTIEYVRVSESISWLERRHRFILQAMLRDGRTWTIHRGGLVTGDLPSLGYQIAHFIGVPFQTELP